MKALKKSTPSGSSLLQDIDRLVPPPHWLSKLEADQFHQLRQKISEAIEPQNFLECIYANELTCLLWQIRENQERISSLVASAREEGMLRLLSGRCDDLSNLITLMRRRDAKAAAVIAERLNELGLTAADINAHARSVIIKEIDVLERDTDAKRDQFDRLVQNFERRRFLIAERLSRHIVLPLRDPQFVVEPDEKTSE